MEASLIFPHQLFEAHPAVSPHRPCYLIEDVLYFKQFPFHKHKLILHRASMQAFAASLRAKGITVHYIEANDYPDLRTFLQTLPSKGVDQIHYVAPCDYLLTHYLDEAHKAGHFQTKVYENPAFLTSQDQIKDMLKRTKVYRMQAFYIEQRKRLNLLVDADQKPLGGKWSLDDQNRKKLPKNHRCPTPWEVPTNPYVEEATAYVNTHFSANVGRTQQFHYATTHAEAKQCLNDFLEHRMTLFGDYEDAFEPNEATLYHSTLSPYLNIGLLTPKQVLDALLRAHARYNYPLNSLEGFIRQLIGWREYMRGIYLLEGSYERIKNYWNFSEAMPKAFWTASTGLPPVDHAIRRTLDTAYCHHIERLMVLGNSMLLCEIHPDAVYKWFMTLFIDAYDWVMVPNIYGMSQYADGGLITTKPYISGANYIKKMSHYPKGAWQNDWDGLYWNFIQKQKQTFLKSPRMSLMAKLFERMPAKTQMQHQTTAEAFLAKLRSS